MVSSSLQVVWVLVASTLAARSLAQLQVPLSIYGSNPDVCTVLSRQLPGSVSFPGDVEYTNQGSQYWSLLQAEQSPLCRVAPDNVEDVASTLRILHLFDYPFSIKSGGHSSNINASNVAGGVAIDLCKLKDISIADGENSVSVGAGVRWRELYEVLELDGLMVTGARTGSVGVSGYLLGGGISYYSSIHGWACDNIESFEVVLADGSVIKATQTQHSDLFQALKGGGNSFGIVTSIRLKAFKAGALHSAVILYPWDQVAHIIAAQARFANEAHIDTGAATSLSFYRDSAKKEFFGVAGLVSVDQNLHTPILDQFFNIQSISYEELARNMSEMAADMDEGSPNGLRQYRSTFTIKNNAALTLSIAERFKRYASEEKYSHDPAFLPGLLVQPLTIPHIQRDGSSMGLESEDEPLIRKQSNAVHHLPTQADFEVVSLEVRWSMNSKTPLYMSLLTSFIEACEEEAREKSLLHPFKYINYASAEQDAFAAIRHRGRIEQLQSVRDRYDPEHFFDQRLGQRFRI